MERKFLLGERTGAIASSGSTEYSILITEQAGPAVQYAAGELARLVEKATGAVLPIVTEKTGPVISLGDNYYSREKGISVKLSDVTRNGFKIKTVDGDIVIVAVGETALIYAMQRYLELNMGYTYYAPDEERYGCELTARELDVIDYPDFLNRDVYNFSTKEFPENAVKLYLTGGEFSAWHPKYGEGQWWGSLHDQSLAMQLLDYKVYRERYPHWFYGGPGKPYGRDPQICYTEALYSRDEYDKGDWSEPNYDDGRHGMFWTLVYNLINKYIAVETDKSLFQLGMSDNGDYCDCERCSRDVEKYSRSGVAIRFANAVADEVEKWRRENCPEREIYLTMFAYISIVDPPTKKVDGEWIPLDESVMVRDNIIIRYAPIKDYYMFSFLDEKENPESYNAINGWTRVAKRFAVWDYRIDFGSIMTPFPQWLTAQDNIRLYKRMGAVDILHQGCRTSGSTPFNAMDNWARARMLWDSTLEYDELIDEFIGVYYGAAADAIREYKAYLTEHYEWCYRELAYKADSHYSVGWKKDHFPLSFVQRVESIFKKGYDALEAEKESNPERYALEKKRFDGESLFYRFLKMAYYHEDYDKSELAREAQLFGPMGKAIDLRVWYNTFDQFWVTAQLFEKMYPEEN